MKILIVHNEYQQRAGEYAAVQAEIDLLRENEQEIITYMRDNAEIMSYGLRQKAEFFLKTIYNPHTVAEIQELIARERPDVAHIHNVFPLISPSVYWALKRAGIPIVQTIHNFRMICTNGLFFTRGQICERCKFGNTLHAVRWRCYRESYVLSLLYAFTIGLHRRLKTFKLIDRFIVLTEFAAVKLVESGIASSEKIRVLGNFLQQPLTEPAILEEREPYVVYVGRLSPEKGVKTLIESAATLSQVGVKVLGDGPQMAELRSIAESSPNVNFLGFVQGSLKRDILRKASATVLPSLCYENFPIAALESMSVGTPLVASDLGSLPFLVDKDRCGLLFRPGDPNDLKSKIAFMVANPSKVMEMGNRALHKVQEDFSAQMHYQKLHDIFCELTKVS